MSQLMMVIEIMETGAVYQKIKERVIKIILTKCIFTVACCFYGCILARLYIWIHLGLEKRHMPMFITIPDVSTFSIALFISTAFQWAALEAI